MLIYKVVNRLDFELKKSILYFALNINYGVCIVSIISLT